jgi:uncharacterized protein (DUF924 family)
MWSLDMSRETIAEDVLSFWFGPEPLETRVVWFQKDPEFDAQIIDKFGAIYEEAATGTLDALADAPLGCLALVIILDQFPRNMFRDDARAYATDEMALRLTKAAIESGLDRDMTTLQRQFLYMPYQHSEVLEDQRLSVELFATVDANTHGYAVRHLEIIERFGRFPHRNAVLGRESTQEETAFLSEPNSSF